MKTTTTPTRSLQQFRQGDVLLEQLSRQGDLLLDQFGQLIDLLKYKQLSSRKWPIILAEGEATGHVHAVASTNCVLWDQGKRRILEVMSPCNVQHEEHCPIVLQPGYYRVIRQREYHPKRPTLVTD